MKKFYFEIIENGEKHNIYQMADNIQEAEYMVKRAHPNLTDIKFIKFE